MLYGVSKTEYGVFPALFSRVHPARRTPHYAVALIGVATRPFVLLGDVGLVAGLANVMLLVVFGALAGVGSWLTDDATTAGGPG